MKNGSWAFKCWALKNIGVLMRKFAYLFLLAGLTLLLSSTSWATGRLNFMLVNQTGQDIVDAKICPTYFPKFESENLLKKALDSDSKVYIGPNYYGGQTFWTIALKWANGHEQTFPKLRLTRYNTYTVYSTPQGIKIRQTYEPAFARYEFGPDAPSYMGAEPEVAVKVSEPQKLEKTRGTVITPTVEPGKADAKAAPRNLTFADVPDQKATALKTTVETIRDGKVNTVSPNGDFKAGDKIRMVFSANKDGHIYWIKKNADGQYEVLFPTKAGMDNAVVRNKEYTVPAVEPLQLGNGQGTETIFAVMAPKAVPDLDKAIKLDAEGKRTEASSLVADIVNAHEQKRTASELIFEEEDDEDVNTQSQLADGETVFVGNYEISHN